MFWRMSALMLVPIVTFSVLADVNAKAQETGGVAAEGYFQLVRPEVSAALKLDEEQTVQVRRILEDRDSALTGAEESARAGILSAAESRLKQLLSEDQSRLFITLFTGKTLRFNFRNQKWAEVLDWVAGQSDLSLVMDTPPPGTFTYSDSKNYTTAESIDLLNGWLLTKGFTLARRERMLMCLDLKGGLPEGAVPRVTPDELNIRSRFEFVSVLLPLEGRPAEAVLTEIKPLLGAYGKAESLAQTQQLLVIDTAQTLRVIRDVVNRIPVSPGYSGTLTAREPIVVVYPIRHGNPLQAADVLKQVVVGNVVADEKAMQITVNASPFEQVKARTIIEQLESNQGPDQQPKLQIYSLQVSDETQLLATLRLIVPNGQYRVDSDSGKLIAWASDKDQQRISEALERLQAETQIDAAGASRSLKAYRLSPGTSLSTVVSLISTQVPRAGITSDTENRRLLIVAGEQEHTRIAEVIRQTETELTSGLRELKFYDVASVGTADTRTLLASTFPDISFLPSAEGHKLMAWVSPEQHDQIESTLKILRSEQPFTATRRLELYSVRDLGPSASSVLAAAVPGASISAGAATDQLAIVATAGDHEKLRNTLEQLQNARSVPAAKTLTVHSIQGVSSSAVMQVLSPLMDGDVQLTIDSAGRQLFVRASADKQDQIRSIITQVTASIAAQSERETHTYVVGAPNAPDVKDVLTALFRDATIVTDSERKLVIATASPEQHATIRDIVNEFTNAPPMKNSPEARAYRLQGDYGRSLVGMIDELFRRSENVRSTWNADSRTLVALARPDQHDLIRRLVEELEPGTDNQTPRTLEVYPLSGLDGDAAVQIVESILRPVDPFGAVSWQRTSRHLLVTSTAEGHKQVRSTVDSFQQNDPREVEVFALRILSPSSAQNAVEGLFGGSFTRSGDYPVVQADEDLQQLLVRGTPRQLQEIRTLLIRMGERHLDEPSQTSAISSPDRSAQNVRVIPIQGDVESTVRKIQDLWPRVRRNPVRIMRPVTEPNHSASEIHGKSDAADVDESSGQCFIQESDNPSGEPQEALPSASSDPPTVIIIPGPDRITIASDDLEALDQLESILRAAASRLPEQVGTTRNRDFSVYQLRNAGAQEVSDTLKSVYESRAGRLAFGSVVIVPEPRLNTLIVYGSRTDRDRIEQLLEILDTERLSDSGRIFRTQVIPVQHADAVKVDVVLRGVYRTEMSAGGVRRAIDIPAGIDSSVAAVLRQINAAASAPLLTIEVQRETNSLVVKAPQNLIDELTELVTQLDTTAATTRARGVTLIPLKKTNSRRVMDVLKNVMD